ncbi:hypothetical protein BDV12DRAFT_107476 [Aspergillus spectabilis]
MKMSRTRHRRKTMPTTLADSMAWTKAALETLTSRNSAVFLAPVVPVTFLARKNRMTTSCPSLRKLTPRPTISPQRSRRFRKHWSFWRFCRSWGRIWARLAVGRAPTYNGQHYRLFTSIHYAVNIQYPG